MRVRAALRRGLAAATTWWRLPGDRAPLPPETAALLAALQLSGSYDPLSPFPPAFARLAALQRLADLRRAQDAAGTGSAAYPGLSATAAASLALRAPTTTRSISPGSAQVRYSGALTGFKLGVPLLRLDRSVAGFRGLTRGRGLPYTGRSEASCLHDPAHLTPVRGCECGFYAYLDEHAAWVSWLQDPRARTALLLEVGVSGRFVRYERGIRFQHQEVRAVRVGPCPGSAGRGCAAPSTLLAYRPGDAVHALSAPDVLGRIDEDGPLAPGWVRLRRRCGSCVPRGWGVVSFEEFTCLAGLAPAALRSTGGARALSPSEVAQLSCELDAHPGW